MASTSMVASATPDRRSVDSRWLVLLVVCLAQFMVILDATIVNVALPSIQRGLHFSDANLQWVINSYTLVFGGFLLLGGRLADLLGRRRLFVAGVVVFTIASLINGLAQSSGMLVAGRALQGLGGAMVSPAALSIVTTTFTDTKERTRALGVWSAIAVGGGAIGLLVGGILTDALSWEWNFIVNVPVGIFALLMTMRYVPESHGQLGHRSFDIAGAVSVTGGLMVLVFGIVKARGWGWTSGRTAATFALAAAALIAFVVIELRSRYPLMRLGILRQRALAAGNLILLLVVSGMFAMFFFSSLYVQNVWDYSPLKAGLAFLPMTAAILVGVALSQRFMPIAGLRGVLTTGLAIATVGMALLTGIPVDGSYLTDFLVGILPLALGLGLAFVPITLLATSGVAPEDAGLASGLFNTMQQVGGALGLAILSTLAADATSDSLADAGAATRAAQLQAQVDGFQVAFTGGAIVLAAGAVLSVVLLRRRHLPEITAEMDPAAAVA